MATLPLRTELNEQLGNKIYSKALYTFVKLNRHNIWSVLGFGHHASDPETSNDTDSESGSLFPGLNDYHAFEIEVPFDKWNEFQKRLNTKTKLLKLKKGNIPF